MTRSRALLSAGAVFLAAGGVLVAACTQPPPPAVPAAPAAPGATPAPATDVVAKFRGRMTKDGPRGLYFMTRYWLATRTLDKEVWFFADDGRLFVNLTGGVSPEDLKTHKGRKGAYRVVGDKLTIDWGNGRPETNTLEKDKNDDFNYDAGIFTPAEPIRDKKSLVGNYGGGESLVKNDNRVIVSKTLALRADGTFEMGGVAAVQGGKDLTGSDAQEVRGTWDAAGYTLTLTLTGGKVVRRFAFPVGDEWLYVSGLVYRREKAKR